MKIIINICIFSPFSLMQFLSPAVKAQRSAAEPSEAVSSSTDLIPSDISHSSTGSSNTVSLCLGMRSGLPHSLYVACCKWSSAHSPALPCYQHHPTTHTYLGCIAGPLLAAVSPTDKGFSPQNCYRGLNSLQGGFHVTS